MTIVALVRHGITDWNIQKRAQGQTDISLNESGRKQAEALAERFAAGSWDVVVTSDLSRARDTAEAIADRAKIKQIIADPDAREGHGGLIEGTTEEERVRLWGPNWRELDLHVEDGKRLGERGARFIDRLANRFTGQRIIVVSHGSWIIHTLGALAPELNTEAHLENASVTILEKANGEWRCPLYNCISHLLSL